MQLRDFDGCRFLVLKGHLLDVNERNNCSEDVAIFSNRRTTPVTITKKPHDNKLI